jgi:hypothetical protein
VKNCNHFCFEAKWKQIFFSSMQKNEMKRKQNEKEGKTSKRKRIEWNSGTICKESKKNIRLVFYFFMSLPSMVKRSEKMFISFGFEAKRKDRKRNEKFL